jgi:hypothetical protein
MENVPGGNEQPKTIEQITFKIAEKNDTVKRDVMGLLHEYPRQFIHGLFESAAEKDFLDSDIMVAYDGSTAVGCLMFNRSTNEFNWLAVKNDAAVSKAAIAKRLFVSFYPTIVPGCEVHLFVNTEDALIAGYPDFSGKNFESARNLYRAMGLELKPENRVVDKYGSGSHAYNVSWVPNKI